MAGFLTFAVEGVATFEQPEATALLTEHWRELCADRETMPLEPDWDLFRLAESKGILIVVTARLAGELVGYVVAFLRPHPHSRSVLCAFEDLHFLRPDLRGQGHGRALLRVAMHEARARGAVLMFVHGKLAHDDGGHLRTLGFRPMDYIYMAML